MGNKCCETQCRKGDDMETLDLESAQTRENNLNTIDLLNENINVKTVRVLKIHCSKLHHKCLSHMLAKESINKKVSETPMSSFYKDSWPSPFVRVLPSELSKETESIKLPSNDTPKIAEPTKFDKRPTQPFEVSKKPINKTKSALLQPESGSNTLKRTNPRKSVMGMVVDPSNFRVESKCPLEEKYEILYMIGKGTFGEVKKIRDRDTKIERAVKIVKKEKCKVSSSLIEEIEILKKLVFFTNIIFL